MSIRYSRGLYGLVIVVLLLGTGSLALAQSPGCLGSISGRDCQLFEDALDQFASAEAVEISMRFATEIAMGNMMSQNTSGEARGSIVLDDQGQVVEASLIIDPLSAKTGGFAGLYSTGGDNTMVGGFILKDGVMYFGLGVDADSLDWFSVSSPQPGLSSTRSLPINFFAMTPSVVNGWRRVDDLVFENDDRAWAAFESYVSTDTPMTEALALIGGASGQNNSDAAVGAMFGGIMGLGFDSEFPSLVEYYGNIYVEPDSHELGGFGTITSVQVDAGSVMGGDLFSSMVGSTGSILNSLVVHMLDYTVEPDISAPEDSQPLSGSLASMAQIFSMNGFYTAISGTFPQILANLVLLGGSGSTGSAGSATSIDSGNTSSGTSDTPAEVEEAWVPSSTEIITVPAGDFDTYPGGYRVEIYQYEIDPGRDTVRMYFEATASSNDLRPPTGTFLVTPVGRVFPSDEEWTSSSLTHYSGWLEFEGEYFRASGNNALDYCGCGLYSISITDLRSFYQ